MQKIILRVNEILKKHPAVSVFLCLYFLVSAYKIIFFPTPFFDWDESIYAQSGKEMIAQKSYLVPLWQGSPWLDKPPLPSFVYGVTMAISPFSDEVSTRIVTLFLSVIVLLFFYSFYYRLTKNRITATTSVVITAFIPSFLQRSQVLNVDVFLLLGWIGYLHFQKRFLPGLFFLTVGVLSKSLLGFYPIVMFLVFDIFLLFFRKQSRKVVFSRIKMRCMQTALASVWFMLMIFEYGSNFLYSHFYESHFKRVSASIESHFGKRTFYIELLLAELALFAIPAVFGIIYVCYQWIKKRNDLNFFYLLFFVPWFLFLNLTKTKIAWYIYPVIPQFAFLAAYITEILMKYRYAQLLIAVVFCLSVVAYNFGDNAFIKTQYSSEDDSYKIALLARSKCEKLDYLVDTQTREANKTLKSMNLLITSSEWWGNHPRVVYYFGKKVQYLYSMDEYKKQINKSSCLALSLQDADMAMLQTAGLRQDKIIGDMVLFVR